MSVIDYTNVDYKGFKNMMIATLQELLPEYTDTSETDAGIVIMEAVSRVMDIISYYQNVQANECFLSSAEMRSNVMKWCRTLGYTPYSHIPAKYKQHFVISHGSGRVVIPKGTVLRTKEKTADLAVYFTTLETLDIVADSSAMADNHYVSTNVDENGNPVSYVFGVDIAHGVLIKNEEHTYSSVKDFKITLNNSPVVLPEFDDDGYALLPRKGELPVGYDEARNFVLMVATKVGDNGETVPVEWTMKNSFIDSTSQSTDYTIEVTRDNSVVITFGDGINGKIPEGNITVSYRKGGGTAGNVGANTITVMSSSIAGVIETYNPDLPYSKGYDKETLEEIKLNAPNAYRTKWCCVQADDYADRVKYLFPEIKMASSYRKTDRYPVIPTAEGMVSLEDLTVIDTMQICVLPDEQTYDSITGEYKQLADFGIISSDSEVYAELYADILNRMSERALVGTYIELVPFESKKIFLNCTLLPSADSAFEDVEQQVRDYLKGYFSVGNIKAGQTLSLTELEADVYASIKGVRAFRINYHTVNSSSDKSYDLDIFSKLWEIFELEGISIQSTTEVARTGG